MAATEWRRFRPGDGPHGDIHAFKRFVNGGRKALCGCPRDKTRATGRFQDWETQKCNLCETLNTMLETPPNNLDWRHERMT